MRGELANILEHVVRDRPRSTSPSVPPTSHPLDLANVLSADEPRPVVAQEEALRNAPDPADGGFRVPPIGA